VRQLEAEAALLSAAWKGNPLKASRVLEAFAGNAQPGGRRAELMDHLIAAPRIWSAKLPG